MTRNHWRTRLVPAVWTKHFTKRRRGRRYGHCCGCPAENGGGETRRVSLGHVIGRARGGGKSWERGKTLFRAHGTRFELDGTASFPYIIRLILLCRNITQNTIISRGRVLPADCFRAECESHYGAVYKQTHTHTRGAHTPYAMRSQSHRLGPWWGYNHTVHLQLLPRGVVTLLRSYLVDGGGQVKV